MENQTSKKKINQEFILKFIKTNIKIVYGIIAILIILILILFFYNEKIKKNNIELSQQFIRATILEKSGKSNDAKKMLIEIIEKKNKFYSPLSLNLLIEQKLETNSKTVLDLYDKVINIKSLEKNYKDLLEYKKLAFLISTETDEKIISDLIENISKDKTSIWKKSVYTLLEKYYKNKGDIKKFEFYKNELKTFKFN